VAAASHQLAVLIFNSTGYVGSFRVAGASQLLRAMLKAFDARRT
jgi:hypothetical protein